MESLTKCPACNEPFNDSDGLPRRMSCCVQSICQTCLQRSRIEEKVFSCPLCRHVHFLDDGLTSLYTDPLILEILDHLKIKEGNCLPCTDCPDNYEANARCNDCCVFLCEECHRAHARHTFSRSHKTVTFEEMKSRPMESFCRVHNCKEHHQPQQFYCFTCSKVICVSCIVLQHMGKGHKVVSVDEAHQDKAKYTDVLLTKLDGKAEKLSQSVESLRIKKSNLQISTQKATDDINQTFDNMIETIQTRRGILLSDVEEKSSKELKATEEAIESTTTLLTKVRSSSEYTRQMRERTDKIDDLQFMMSSSDALKTMLAEKPQDLGFDRMGVSFRPYHVKQLTTLVESLGTTMTVMFKPIQRPQYVGENEAYNGIVMVPSDFPQVPDEDMTISERDLAIICPHLEWGPNTASDDVTITGSVVTNNKQTALPPDTGCQINAPRRVMSSRPLTVERGQRVMFHVKVKFSTRVMIEATKMIFELALTSSPVDASRHQPAGLSVQVTACPIHKEQICLGVWYDGKFLTDSPVSLNQTGASCGLHLCFLLDRDANSINVITVHNVKLLHTTKEVVFVRPLWLMMYIDTPAW